MITKEQLEKRKNHIGASDIPALFNLDRFRNAYDLWLDKTDRLEEGKQLEIAAKIEVQLGRRLEPVTLEMAEENLGALDKKAPEASVGILLAHPDAIVVASKIPVEAKVEGWAGPLRKQWGEAGTDEVPESVVLQTHAQMICTKAELSHIAALLGGRGFLMFLVPLEKELAEIIMEKANEFWTKNVQSDTPPENLAPSPDYYRYIKRKEGVTVRLDNHLILSWRQAVDIEKLAAKQTEEHLGKIMAALKEAEIGESDYGRLTYKKQKRKGYTVRETEYRVLRFKENKLLEGEKS